MPIDAASDPDAPASARSRPSSRRQGAASAPSGQPTGLTGLMRRSRPDCEVGCWRDTPVPRTGDRAARSHRSHRRPRGHWPDRLQTRHRAILTSPQPCRRGRPRIDRRSIVPGASRCSCQHGRRGHARPRTADRARWRPARRSRPATRSASRVDGGATLALGASLRPSPGRCRRPDRRPRERERPARAHRRPVVPSRDAARRRDLPGHDRSDHLVRARDRVRPRSRADADGGRPDPAPRPAARRACHGSGDQRHGRPGRCRWVDARATTGASELAVEPIDPATLDDPWLVANASADRALGLDLGVLDAGAPTATPTAPDGTTDRTAGSHPGHDPRDRTSVVDAQRAAGDPAADAEAGCGPEREGDGQADREADRPADPDAPTEAVSGSGLAPESDVV